ncbi:hypothetical protein TRICI_004955 [Trichomonascus ciferrii]|uniref:CST complex subunit Stn1 N-terminal domain-containing protein n=1 Tax=Trichomonascus ciferrii TaxID=44093 RepID=A0A642UY91_9ASCO|nr:hypothetical protein TRICI_004955 [Trichomonascus ciferrii]
MCVRDVYCLDKFETIYERKSELTGRGRIYFFRNHPINYVLLTGRCVDVGETSIRSKTRPGVLYTFTIEDGSGPMIGCAYIYNTKNPGMFRNKGLMLEVRGYIYDSPGFPRRISVCNFRVLRKSVAQERHLILASMEQVDVRKRILENSWYCPEAENQKRPVARDLVSEPNEYCSFYRLPSVLLSRPDYRQSIREAERNETSETEISRISTNGTVPDAHHQPTHQSYLLGNSMNPIILSDDRVSMRNPGSTAHQPVAGIFTYEGDHADSCRLEVPDSGSQQPPSTLCNDEFDSLCEDLPPLNTFYSQFDKLAS